MKREAFNHPKMKLFARLLGVPLYAANGLIARLWRFTSDHAPAGDIGRWEDWQIADDLGWDDSDCLKLINALVNSGFVDQSEYCRLVVHDWPDHCEDAVHSKLAKDGLYFADGTKPKLTRYNKDERAEIEEKYRNNHSPHGAARKNAETHGPARTSPCLTLPLPLLAKPSLGVQGELAASPSVAVATPPAPNVVSKSSQQVIDAWNAVADAEGFARIRQLNKPRSRALRARLAEPGWDWSAALDRIRGSPFCHGTNDRGWKADFEWFIRPDTVCRILEGKYDDTRPPDSENPFV